MYGSYARPRGRKFAPMQQWIVRSCQVTGLIILLVTLTGTLWPDHAERPLPLDLLTRQLGHDYLLATGDATSLIPPVINHPDGRYELRLSDTVDYDLLAATALSTFGKAELNRGYTIELNDCLTQESFLGAAFSNPGFTELATLSDAACIGRDQQARCANVMVRYFSLPPGRSRPPPYLLGGFGLLLLLVSSAVQLSRKKRESNNHPLVVTPDIQQPAIYRDEGPTEAVPSSKIIISEDCSFDPRALELVTAAGAAAITFREAKLLGFLNSHKNEVLPRAVIHAAVWEEEGVLTGRSLDVFISRLRKKLKATDAVEIQTVHGVGYRFRVD